MKTKLLNVSQISSPGSSDTPQQFVESLTIPPTSSRNLPELYVQDFNQGNLNNQNESELKEESQRVRFREKYLDDKRVKFTSPSQSNPASNNGTLNNISQQINSPSCIKVIDLRNPQIRKLVMDSLNEIVAERKKLRNQHNQNFDQILQSTPQTFRVHNSINEDAVLIEKGNLVGESQQLLNNRDDQKPPSRISLTGFQQSQVNGQNNGILRMSPRSQGKFFYSLQKIYEEQDSRGYGQDFVEEPNSPEYTIVSAIDDSCVLFAVKETQQFPSGSMNQRSDNSSLEQTQKQITPNLNRNLHDPQGPSILDNAEMFQQLTQRLEGIENQENQDLNQERARAYEQAGQGLVEQYSTDRQFLMIHPRNIKKLTPTIKAPQVSRQPSQSQIHFFDLSIPQHVDILCQRLNQLRNIESVQPFHNRNQSEENSEENSEIRQIEINENTDLEVSTDNLTTIFLSYLDDVENNQSHINDARTPLQTRGPPSRAGNFNDQIDIEILITKLLEIPNEALLDSLINISRESKTPTQNLLSQQNSEQALRESDSRGFSGVPSSGAMTPQSNSLSTPIQAKLFMEKGYLFNGQQKQGRGLDLRSPQTKFNLMRKLNAVKEQNNSSEDEEEEDPDFQNVDRFETPQEESQVAGSVQHLSSSQNLGTGRFNNDYSSSLLFNQQQQQFANPSNGIELRAINDFTRLFINEEDEDDENQDESASYGGIRGQHSQPISLVSPQRSLNQTMSQLQLRNQNNQFQPSIELLIQKLKNLESKRLRYGNRLRQYKSQQSSENDSPSKFESLTVNNNQIGGNQNKDQAESNILEQVIKRLERLKSRDSSV